MTTALTIVTDALQKLGVYAPGEVISDADASRGLALLNDMMDEWLSDSIQLFSLVSVSASLVNNTQSYTIGPGATINTARPYRVVTGPGVATILSGATTTALSVVSALEWAQLYNPANLSNATPTFMNYDPQFPNGVLNFSPIPNGAMTATFNAMAGITSFALLSTNYSMSPGQQLAFTTNLALMLNKYFGMGQVSPDLMAEAQHTKTLLATIQRMSRALLRRNTQPQTPIAARQ